ncbi:MAG: ribonuclease T [Xanthomonadales bacterium]|nr:ribonuclease T [Xanthomonadales bacterium]MCC6561068.1 ribonuclease T [Xanthomonadales bacterium]
MPLTKFNARLAERFRGFLPVVVDVETGGFDSERDALLEIAAVPILMNENGEVVRAETVSTHVVPFPGANIDPRALEITGIDPTHPFRAALDEKVALDHIFQPLRKLMKATDCTRAVLVGHNAHFDLGFVNAAIKRTGHKRSPFHPFSCFDTVTLGGLALGQTVLSRAVQAAGLNWNSDEAHSAVYDAETTADLFCLIVNRWKYFVDVAPDATPMAALPPDAEADIAAATLEEP